MSVSAVPNLKQKSSALDELQRDIDALLEFIQNHQRFLVVSHANPDGDAIGSTLSFGLILEQLGKEVTYYNQDDIPYNLEFLEASNRITDSIDAPDQFDVTVVLDCSEKGRVGSQIPEEAWSHPIAVIDHHDTWDGGFGDYWVHSTEAAATGELVYYIARQAGVELTDSIARCIYCTILTDTGGFRYSNTSKETFQLAGELLDAGVDPWDITAKLYENQPIDRLELLSEVLDTLELSPCGRLAFLRIERDMFEDGELSRDLTDGFINYGRSVRGVEVATQLREEGDDLWKISFRSKGKVDVSSLAMKFGGGGHRNAAGCQIQGTPEQIENELTEALIELLDNPS